MSQKQDFVPIFRNFTIFKDLELFNENEVSIFIYIQYTIYKMYYIIYVVVELGHVVLAAAQMMNMQQVIYLFFKKLVHF